MKGCFYRIEAALSVREITAHFGFRSKMAAAEQACAVMAEPHSNTLAVRYKLSLYFAIFC